MDHLASDKAGPAAGGGGPAAGKAGPAVGAKGPTAGMAGLTLGRAGLAAGGLAGIALLLTAAAPLPQAVADRVGEATAMRPVPNPTPSRAPVSVAPANSQAAGSLAGQPASRSADGASLVAPATDPGVVVPMPDLAPDPALDVGAQAAGRADRVDISIPMAVPERLRIPALRLDVEVAVDRTAPGESFTPAGASRAYWLSAYGRPGTDATGTVYLGGHSWGGGPAVFNALFDRARQRPRVQVGDLIELTTAEGRLRYRVESTQRFSKNDIAQVPGLWDVVPGRLVLITCFQPKDGGKAQDNLIVYARLSSA